MQSHTSITICKCLALLIASLLATYGTGQVSATGPIMPGDQPPHTQATSTSTPPPDPELRIGTGDLLEINVYSVFGAPDTSQKARVDSEGDISLPLIGLVHVAGLTAEGAQKLIAQRFREGEFLKNPQVSVFISEYASQGVSVLGEVTKPGIYPLVSSRTLLDMISTAGGLTPNAGDLVTITRRQPPHEQISTALTGPGAKPDIPILPGDTILVEKTGIIYVVGNVGKPGGFPINKNAELTILQAIALAEGTKPSAALDQSRLIRKSHGNAAEVDIPLKKILAGKSPDLPLQAGDIVFVPYSAAKGAARKGLEAVLQTAVGVAIYRP